MESPLKFQDGVASINNPSANKIEPIQTFGKRGSELYGQAETALAVAMDALQKLASLHMDAYQHGHQGGADALRARDAALSFCGDLAALHSDLLAQHERDTERLRAAGGSPVGNYKELPAALGPRPTSGGPR